MVDLIIDEKSSKEIQDKILVNFAFLLQREMILRLPPRFRNRIAVVKEGVNWIVGSNDEIFKYYIFGTKPHIIKPKNKKALAFGWPKAPVPPTSPKSGMWLYKEVKHPGTKGNNIIEDIENDRELLKRLLDKAIKNVIK